MQKRSPARRMTYREWKIRKCLRLARNWVLFLAARWVPLEEGYFAQYHIAETADFVVDTTQSETI